MQDKARDLGRIGIHAVSDIASDMTPAFLERRGFKSVPKSVAYGYTASGYGFVQDMPYAYVHEFTRTSMAGKIRRFKDGYTSLWKKVSESLPITVMCQTEVLSVRRDSTGVKIDVKNSSGDFESMEFDKLMLSGAFPFRLGRTYRSPSSSIPAGIICLYIKICRLVNTLVLTCLAKLGTWPNANCCSNVGKSTFQID